MQIAICHDYLTQRGGAERAVLALSSAFPDAPIYTSFHVPEGTFDEFRTKQVRPSPANRLAPLRSHFRSVLPLYPAIFSGRRIDAETTICSSSGWAHGVRTTGRKVVYCHAPARWLYQSDDYLRSFGTLQRVGLRAMASPLRSWDRRAASSADLYLANSRRTRDMVRDAYGIDSVVLPPPHAMDVDGRRHEVPGTEPGYFLVVSRLLGYKHVTEVVEAFRTLPRERLVVVGEGPLADELAADRPSNVTLLGRVTDAELRWLYANAKALVAVAYEDLGLTPMEAAAFGTPCLALRFGGYLDTVVEGVNGHFIEEATPAAIASGVTRMRVEDLDPHQIAVTANRYTRSSFERRLNEALGFRAVEPTSERATFDPPGPAVTEETVRAPGSRPEVSP